MAWVQSLTPLDYVILTVLVVAFLVGWTRGLADLLTGFLVFALSTFVAGHYAGAAVAWLNRGWNLEVRLAEVLARRIHLPAEAYRVPMNQIPWQKALGWLHAVPVPLTYKETLAQRLVDWSRDAGSRTAADYIAHQLAAGVLDTVVFLTLAALVGWVLGMVARLVSDQIKEIPLVGTVNRMLGSAVVMAEVVVVMALLVGLVAPALSTYGGETFGGVIQNAHLAPYFLRVYEWLRSVVFGKAGGPFFIS
jgi:uncharacterized membrane protein required for colicin V production